MENGISMMPTFLDHVLSYLVTKNTFAATAFAAQLPLLQKVSLELATVQIFSPRNLK